MPSGPGMLLADAAERGDVGRLMAAVRDTVRSWIGVGPVFVATADPVTGSFTRAATFDIPDEAAATFLSIELAGRDVVSFDTLARSPTPLRSLFDATSAKPEASERGREVIGPLGWGDELRAAVRLDGCTWGYLCVHREAAERPFGRPELTKLGALLPAIAVAMRRVTLSAAETATALPTGVVLVDQHGRIAGATGGAESWLEELGDRPQDRLPLLLDGLTRQVFGSGLPVTTTISTRTGRVGTVEVAPLQGFGDRQVAVVFSPAPARHQLDRLAAASLLTAREREIVSYLLTGMSTRAISERLTISQYTVQAHLTSVFSKTGLRSRRELLSRLSR